MHKSLTDYWWLVVLRGIIALIFGLALIAYPGKTATVVIALIGLYLLIEGIIVSISALFSIKKNDHWWVLLLRGILTLLVGVAIFSWPQATVAVLFFLFALWLLIMGIFFVVTAIIVRKETEMEWFLVAAGVVSLLMGVLLINNPYASFTIIAILTGIYAIVSGILITSFGFKLKSFKHRLAKEAKGE